MSEPIATSKPRWLPKAWVYLMGLAAYFGFGLVSEGWLASAYPVGFLLYLTSIPFVLLGLLVVAMQGISRAIVSLWCGASVTPRDRAHVLVPIAVFLLWGSITQLEQEPHGLPRGSHLLEFDPAVWQHPHSSKIIGDDITVRQKMLGSLVERLDTSQSRAELEALLGPSLQTPYFNNTGRDLIYVLGPTRWFVRIDHEWLLIWLDNSNHFERYAIYED